MKLEAKYLERYFCFGGVVFGEEVERCCSLRTTSFNTKAALASMLEGLGVSEPQYHRAVETGEVMSLEQSPGARLTSMPSLA